MVKANDITLEVADKKSTTQLFISVDDVISKLIQLRIFLSRSKGNRNGCCYALLIEETIKLPQERIEFPIR